MKGYLSTAATLKLLDISRTKLKRLIADGFLTPLVLGHSGAWFFKASEVRAVLRPVAKEVKP